MKKRTGIGDSGLTLLYMGGPVPKDDLRIELNGALDELSSFLGMSKSLIKDEKVKSVIESLQKDIFIICSEVAAAPAALIKLKRKLNKNFVQRIEDCAENLTCNRIDNLKSFCLPGGNDVSAVLDISRTIARRAERNAVTLKRKGALKNKDIIPYLNRLSDLLYVLARKFE